MTVSSEQSFIEYNGDGTTKTFTIPFYFILGSDISITITDSTGSSFELVYGINFSVVGDGSPSGGAATLNTAPALGSVVNISRDPPVTQETAYQENGKFPAESHEKALDKLTMIDQSIVHNLNILSSKAVKVPEAGNWVAPKISDRNNRVFAWDNEGKPIAVLPASGSASDVMIQLASTADGNGDALIGVKQPTTNAAPLTQHDVNLRTISIQDYGNPRAKDDYNGISGTNCWLALLGIIADFPNGCRIRLPRTVGGTGKYFMSGTGGSADMSKYVIDPDPGVEIIHTGSNTPLIARGLVVTRPLNITLTTLGYTYRLSPTPYGAVSGKPYIISPADGESPELERANTSVDMAVNIVNPSTGAQSATTFSADGETASFGSIPTGQFTVGHFPVRPGWEYHAQVTMPGASASVAAYIQTENGWIIYSQPIGGGNITRYVFLEGYSVQSSTFSHPLVDNPAYNMDMSEIGIKVHSPTSFSLLCNHVEIARMDGVTSNIVRAGWGAGFANNTNTAYISYPALIKKNHTYGMRPLRIVTVGDSTADKINPFSWVNHMARVASGVGGIQFKSILNQAVAGQTSLQQAQIFNNTDFQSLGGFDYALIDVGINDIGGGSSPSQFIDAIVSMINTCTTYNMIPIIGVPAMFYNQAAAAPYGQTGQGTANADRGAPYRLQLLRKLAELNVQVAMLPMQDMGAIVPSLLGNASLDPVVQDNVHQSGWGGELKGAGWAKALIGYLFARTRTDITSRTIKAAWIPSAISGSYGVGAKPSFEIVGDEFGLTGLMDTPAPVPDGTVIMQLPAAYAPKTQIYLPLICQDILGTFLSSVATLRIDTNGTFAVRGVPSTSRYFFFGNCRYRLPS